MESPAETEGAPAPDRPEGPRRRPPPVLFVGGTGRSGTHIVARLLSKTRRYALIPIECRFHADDDGFPGLLAGEVPKVRFLQRLRGFWWKGFQTDRMRGLHRVVPRERFDRAVADFDERFEADPEDACRRLFFDLLGDLRGHEGAAIIEQSCDTIAAARTLVRLFPEARFLHVVRDGRDASASRVRQMRWLVYPRTRRQGLEWWERRPRELAPLLEVVTRDGARAIPEGQLLQVELGDFLVRGPRKPQLGELTQFAGVRPTRRMRRFMRHRMSPDTANQERWRRGLSEPEQAEIDHLYRETLERLEADGVSSAPLLRRAYERSAAGR